MKVLGRIWGEELRERSETMTDTVCKTNGRTRRKVRERTNYNCWRLRQVSSLHESVFIKEGLWERRHIYPVHSVKTGHPAPTFRKTVGKSLFFVSKHSSSQNQKGERKTDLVPTLRTFAVSAKRRYSFYRHTILSGTRYFPPLSFFFPRT